MPQTLTDCRILLIDDQPFNAQLLNSMLATEADMTIEYLSESVHAVPAARAFGPTVVMVDLHMPLVDGLSVIRSLKEDPQLAPVPVIMLSSNENPHIKAEGFTAGAMDYLVKWPDRIELAARARAHSRAYLAIRERDRAMQALSESQAELLERTRQLSDAQASLHEAQKMEAIGELTSGVAHDFNNVLQLINGHLQLLKVSHRTDERTVRRVDAASEGVRRGARLAAQLLAFSRPQTLAPMTLRADVYLHSLRGTLQQVLGERGLRISAQGPVAMTSLDPAQFEKTMFHLARNAAEAMGSDGHLAIEIDSARLPGASGAEPEWMRIRLVDNGCGMKEDVQRRAFEPFFTTKNDGRRSGLGLSLAFSFVKQSGGQIELSGRPGAGTTVTMYFPPVDTKAVPPGERMRNVLVVDDEAPVREASAEVLRKLGLCVLEAADGETALGWIRQGLPIDLLFTDVIMPGKVRGQDLARAMEECLPAAKVLFASGYPGDAEDEVFERVQLMHKPYRLEEMARVVKQLLVLE